MMVGINLNGETLKDIHVNGRDLQAVWVRGEKVWPRMIEDFEGSTNVSDHLRGTDTGNAYITSSAALKPQQGSTQGMRCDGFVERYALPGDNNPDLQAGQEASFYFRPHDLGSNQWHFLISPQTSVSSPPDRCYRLEFHMDAGARIVKMKNGRTILESSSGPNWNKRTYECRFKADSSGVTMTVAGVTLSTSDTEFVDDVMGFGFRATSGGMVDYDWLGYI